MCERQQAGEALVTKAKLIKDLGNMAIHSQKKVLKTDALSATRELFINGSTVTANQIEFINLVVQELTQTGVMEPGRLFESPFTDVNAQGPLGVFPPAKVTQLVGVLTEIRERAVA